MPIEYWKGEAPPKGVSNRNTALKWLIDHLNNNNNNNNNNNKNNNNNNNSNSNSNSNSNIGNGNEEGVLYIADDDNTYDLDLFVEVGLK